MSKNNYSDQAILEYLKNSGNNTKTAYGGLANQYQNILNQPSGADAIGDAFTRGGSGQAVGPAQQQSNALQLGLGAGLKAYANDQKAGKLKAIEDQTSQLLATNAMLEQQMADDSLNRQKISQFFKQSSVNIAELSKASMAGDTGAANSLAQNVLRTYKQLTRDQSVGEFDHYNNGSIYYENPETGNIEGRNIIDTIYQSGINPAEIWGQDAAMIEAGLSPGAAKNYKNAEEERALALQKARSDIGLTQAHTNLYNAQTESTKNEMNAPNQKYDDKTLTHIRTINTDWVNKVKDEDKIVDKNIKAYELIQGALEDEVAKGSKQLGAGFFNEAARVYAMNNGQDKNLAIVKLARQPIFANLKKIFGSQISDADIVNFLATEPGLDQNPDASIPAVKRKIYDLKREVAENKIRRKVVSDIGYAEPYNSVDVDKIVEQDLQQYDSQNPNPDAQSNSNKQTNQQTILATDPETGEQQRISTDMIDEARRRGLLVGE